LDDGFNNTHSVATFPLEDVEMFLTAQKNTFDYHIKKIDKITGSTYKLTKKQSTISYTRTLDSYLTKIENTTPKGNIITVVNNTKDRVISIELLKEFKEIYKNGSEDEQESVSDFLKKGTSILYLTKKNNPYWLLFSFSFIPQDLFEKEILYFNYENNYNDTSVYTKKLINSYGYKEKA
jgi:16S rRNA C1402 (ribose-2'-O) methylase RsmI